MKEVNLCWGTKETNRTGGVRKGRVRRNEAGAGENAQQTTETVMKNYTNE